MRALRGVRPAGGGGVRVGWVLLAGLCSASSVLAQAPRQVRVPRSDVQPSVLRRFGLHASSAANPARDSLSLRPGEVLGARLGTVATNVPRPGVGVPSDTGEAVGDTAGGPSAAPADTRVALPFEFVAVTAAGGELRYRPVAEVEGGAARFDQASRLFTGTVRLGLQPLPGSSAGDLPQPVRLYVVSDADKTDPANVTLNRVGFPYATVSLSAAAPPSALTVRVRTEVDANAVTVSVPVQRPQLELQASPARIQGLGLEVSQIVVRGVGLVSYGSATVTLSTDLGSLDSLVIPLTAQGIGRSSIRSIGTGQARIRAEGPPFLEAGVTVLFVFPWGFLLAALLGGVVGAAARELVQKHARGEEGVGLLRSSAAAVLAGVVVAAAWAIGVNLLGASPAARAGEAVVFVLAALGAYAGHGVLAMKRG